MSELQHAEANTKIYFTREHTRFKSITGNRLLNEAKIKRIIKDIESGLDMLRYCPIIVDKDINVIDGQHRLYVARKLKSNIWYVITDTITLHEIARINSNTEKWNSKDFIHCYAAQGNKDYDILKDFVETNHWPLTIAIIILQCGKSNEGGSGTPKKGFERGEFKATHLQYAHELATTVALFNCYTGHLTASFIHAIAKIKEIGKCDFKLLSKKVAENMPCLTSGSNAKAYMQQLEAAYNIGAKTRKTIF